jgi:hypothetical protein
VANHCTWDDCDDVADYILHVTEGLERVGRPQTVCVVHLTDAIVNMFATLQVERLCGAVVQVEPAD